MAHLGQTVKRGRHGHPHLGLTVYEKTPGGQLHAHHLVHVSRKKQQAFERCCDVYEPRPSGERFDVDIHARPVVPTDANYATKQRLRYSPEFEATIKHHNRQAGASIPGGRWTATTAMRELAMPKVAASLGKPCQRTDTKIPAITVAPTTLAAPWRAHGLFDQLPLQPVPAPLRQAICRARPKLINVAQRALDFDRRPDAIDIMRGLGGTHQEVAAKVGLSRPQTTNILNRQFGASRRVVRRVLALAMAA